MSNYIPTIGLEIHAELKTRTKMFCDSPNNPDEPEPNVNVCPVCMAHPGTLPVINFEAVKHMVRIGTAVGGEIADFTEFDRKNYFYPDIPKGYQISQYKFPLVSGGTLAGVDLTRIHLEEDTATSTHLSASQTRQAGDKGEYSLVNFNRAGVPLMELVTEPVIHDADTAMHFAKELQLLLRYLGASDANMEKGEMRVEANVSISDSDTFGTKVEVKNLNSFRIVGQAIAHEIKRQTELLERGEVVVQETRGWNEQTNETFSQRRKEEADDYRYFPDPDLPKLKLSELRELQHVDLPELPWEVRKRMNQEYGIKNEAIEIFLQDRKLTAFFEEVANKLNKDDALVKSAANYITNNLVALELDHHVTDNINPAVFAEIVHMAQNGEVSSNGAVELITRTAKAFDVGKSIREYAEKENILQKSDVGELQAVVDEVVAENTEVAEEYKNGKEKSLQFLVGQAMKKTQGSANPQMLQELFKEALK